MTWNYGPTFFWVRITKLGWGMQALHRSEPPRFSERYGHRHFWPKWPARWRLGLLRPQPQVKEE